MNVANNKSLISVLPEELKFHFELEKQSFCDLKISNNTDQYVAFKVKTTSPKKYFVRPNTDIVHPWDSCIIRVTLQAQREYPLDMQCKDKFLLQSTTLPSQSEVDELPPNTFNKDGGQTIEERKLRVVYICPNLPEGNSEDEECGPNVNIALQRLRDEREGIIRQTRQLQQELDILRRRKNRKNDESFTLRFTIVVTLIGFMLGILIKLFFFLM